jgi:hypothetical protein
VFTVVAGEMTREQLTVWLREHHCALKRGRPRAPWDNRGTEVYSVDFFRFRHLRRADAGSIPAASTIFSFDS